MGKYELMYILNAGLDEAARKAEIEKLHKILTDNKTTNQEDKEKSIKKIAIMIHDMNKGYYVVLKMTIDNPGLEEFKRLARLDNQVIRFLITVDKD